MNIKGDGAYGIWAMIAPLARSGSANNAFQKTLSIKLYRATATFYARVQFCSALCTRTYFFSVSFLLKKSFSFWTLLAYYVSIFLVIRKHFILFLVSQKHKQT
jgi:hypothetical protein